MNFDVIYPDEKSPLKFEIPRPAGYRSVWDHKLGLRTQELMEEKADLGNDKRRTHNFRRRLKRHQAKVAAASLAAEEKLRAEGCKPILGPHCGSTLAVGHYPDGPATFTQAGGRTLQVSREGDFIIIGDVGPSPNNIPLIPRTSVTARLMTPLSVFIPIYVDLSARELREKIKTSLEEMSTAARLFVDGGEAFIPVSGPHLDPSTLGFFRISQVGGIAKRPLPPLLYRP